jgi:hypothetical protein
MPFNIASGSTVQFTVVFFDSTGAVTVPTSATITVTYPPSSNSLTTVSCAIGMSAAGNFFTATWGSGVAALGLSSATASAPGIVSADPQTLRITS